MSGQELQVQENKNGGEVKQERILKIDFKMVTFSLAGKDYGIDIMNVKEIAKANRFTYVPNTAAFVRGVYNLRGEIIPVIDFRIFFHLPAEQKDENAMENLLIVRKDEQIYGIIVDSIDKVVGVSSEQIQPPHPIFGDINIRYIKGVVEHQGRLYIILDVNRIFSQEEERKRTSIEAEGLPLYTPPAMEGTTPARGEGREGPNQSVPLEVNFIKETLFALKHFATTAMNEKWVLARYEEWKKERQTSDAVQLKDLDDAEAFLKPFYSPYTDQFWGDDYAAAVRSLLPDMPGKTITVWNPGCGKGFETFSFACILRERYPEHRIKIWASDSDLLAISSAPTMAFEYEVFPEYCRPFLVKGKYGYGFNQVIKDAILFEYHDIRNNNPYVDLDIIVARDILSFMSPEEQSKILSDFDEKLKASGLLLIGSHEELPAEEWQFIGKAPVALYSKAK
ncbi:chemotaxis protein CheW [Treponema sp. J25]|jgi:purine-binding chemotaxis protein CheW|uniref:chemotaxis protein CheW n=1 Tax=Treponema sp. J25 TaxID=2094121 RepID=UPI001045818C|nr:chemotaxis protein CheW [Treponema sp. J25]TCW60640.1 chemotaxis protein CheW [Treponema sp. J25]